MSGTNALNIQYIDPDRPTVTEKGFGFDNNLFLNCPDWVSIQGFFQTENTSKILETRLKKILNLKMRSNNHVLK